MIRKKFVSIMHVHSYIKFTQLIGIGRQGNQWSSVTIRLALAVYCRSPSAYEVLKSFGLLQLTFSVNPSSIHWVLSGMH